MTKKEIFLTIALTIDNNLEYLVSHGMVTDEQRRILSELADVLFAIAVEDSE